MNEITASTSPAKIRVLFVGAFSALPGESIRGGQLSACLAILRSPLSDLVDWVLLESMMESIPPPPLPRRAFAAALRTLKFIRHLIISRIEVAMVFSSGEMSLVEKGLMVILGKCAGKRVVFCPRSGFLIREWREQFWTRWWLAQVVRFSDVVVCQGQRWLEFFCSITGSPINRFPIIYNIVSLPDANLAELPAREHAERVLLMGWVEKNKGIFDLVDIAEKFRPELRSLKFVVCGHGRDWNELRQEINRRKLDEMFELRGWVDEEGKLQAMSEADICIMLSHNEGMPNAMIEAMAYGRPVVATAVGAVSDVVMDGKTGMLCQPRDIEDIGSRIVGLLNSRARREAIGLAARAIISRKMSSDVVWRDWLKALAPWHSDAPASKASKEVV